MDKLTTITRIGACLNRVPYAWIPIIGSIYNKNRKSIKQMESMSIDEKKQLIFKKVYAMVKYAIEHVPFYQEFYANHGFSLDMLHTFEDIEKIPVITKKDLMAVPLERRSVKTKMSFVANTGGSTGIPLSFYKRRQDQIKENAYYYHAWSKLGYKQSNLRFQFVGRSESKAIGYDIMRNRLTGSVYKPFDEILEDLARVCRNNSVSYLQGYPSVLYEFALFIESHPDLMSSTGLKDKIRGIFLNSEYPYPEYRKKIEEVLGAGSIASYGHTEGCVLAYDYGDQIYHVEQSYGYAEALQMGDETRIVCTNYDNFASPFIRYDTGDVVDNAHIEQGLLLSFCMTGGGRSGQYIIDKNGKRISLTGLIFGRHHQLFNYCSQMQIAQSAPGIATVYYVAHENDLQGLSPNTLFDTNDIAMDFVFERIDQPIRTKAGKVLLLVKQ